MLNLRIQAPQGSKFDQRARLENGIGKSGFRFIIADFLGAKYRVGSAWSAPDKGGVA